jgi:hypothetical protein|tara:strand:+ start:707 stop:1285 length:579 start_codon:yes stop_codon:yes gene_type:complete
MEVFKLNENDDDEKIILDYIKKEKQFDIFYKNKVSKINIFFIYIVNNKIVKINKDETEIENKILPANKIKELYFKFKNYDNKTFSLSKLLQFNFNITHEKINNFADNEQKIFNSEMFKNNFIKKYSDIKDIYWEDTINYFESLNSVYFIYTYNKNNKTKKIWLNLKKKQKNKQNKTKKKRLKDSVIVINNNL